MMIINHWLPNIGAPELAAAASVRNESSVFVVLVRLGDGLHLSALRPFDAKGFGGWSVGGPGDPALVGLQWWICNVGSHLGTPQRSPCQQLI